jgi:putative hydrolase of the HAD superfamily
MSRLDAVVSDFGGVLTSPLLGAFAAFQVDGVPLPALGLALRAAAERDGVNPLFELETGRLSEPEFLARIERELAVQLGRAITLPRFAERYFAALTPNHELFAYYRRLRGSGLRLALCTNNVREWEPLWRPMLPLDEVFEVVVDSAFVGLRKPDPEIFELTLDRLGVPAGRAVFVDDLDVNVEAARALGMRGVVFRTTDQAIAELDAMLGDG